MKSVTVRYFQRRKVPKEFLKPRPMSQGARPRSRLLGYLAIEIAAVTLAVLIAALRPLGALDEHWSEFALQRASSSKPSAQVSMVEVSPATAKLHTCGHAVTSVLTRGGARAGLVLPPLSQLCEGVFEKAAVDSEVAPPLEALADDIFQIGPSGSIIGFTPELARSELLVALGFAPRRWVAARALTAVPVLHLSQLEAGDARPGLLENRIVVLSLAGGSTPEGREPRAIAALLAAALEDPRRVEIPSWVWAAVALLTSFGVTLIQRRSGTERLGRVGKAFAALVVVALCAGDLLGFGLRLPAASLVLGFSLSHLVLLLPRRVAVARADRDAQEVLKGAGRLLSLQAPGAHDDAEFWRRLARTAAQTHPADDILIAELPPFSWRLKVWPNGESDESVIKERRRDIRRTPYSNLQGAPVASIVHDYLVMKGTPAVLVPLIARGEVEGYLIMIGKGAADEFTAHPERASSLAEGLADLIREYRLARMQDDARRREGGMEGLPFDEDTKVLDRARAAMGELRLLRALVQNAPVGLFYADVFGDVRILGRMAARWLPEFSIEVPAASDGSVDPGQLTLKQLLSGLARKTGAAPPGLTDIDEAGYMLEVSVPAKPGQRVKSLTLRVVPLRKESSLDPTGFVGSLTESAVITASMVPRPSIMQQTVSSLQVFSLSKLLVSLVQDGAHQADGKLQLQTPRVEAHVVAHRAELERALATFLSEAARRAGNKDGPVLAVQEKRARIELRIMDLRLDAPRPALERTLRAPSSPPPGLDALGELIRAVQNSHGDVRLSSDESWGTVLVASLVRARPRVEPPPEVPPLRLYNKPLQIG